ncbi:hypothetical protein [Pseudoduganella chitinolytica]|uniref:Uncharacterized protein n=1 Tax=Pseudoduganella chitinolytica TaxID=34070 RepID=A0ABY8BEH0_9BURK|nr:hypothetical protein [Pseudoduganella chitinolytica]WEF34295.1 hypothetical protein PX653_05850 [Pseudoduganella chitinolytica]
MTRHYLPLSVLCLAGAAHAAPDLDLRIAYSSRTVTAEGVTREARFEETMLRRDGHVWSARVLPPQASARHDHAHGKPGARHAAARATSVHKHFNPALLPRHVTLDGGKVRLEYVDAAAREVIAVPPGEFDNVGFDGSWTRAYYLLDPQRLRALPLAARKSDVPGARWRERQRDGAYERVLWDERREIPLVIESGDVAGTSTHRMVLTVQPGVTHELPWRGLAGYARREYADFLD